MQTRTLGRSGIEVGALGFGCWPIGGLIVEHGRSVGWGDVDDRESIRALHRAVELGVTFFDTADVYGRSEGILGQAFSDRRDSVVLATKFGKTYDRGRHEITGVDLSVRHMREALEGSLKRLRTDVIDLYQLHVGDCSPEHAIELRDGLEELIREGRIRAYGWSTDQVEAAALFAAGRHCAAVQHHQNLLLPHPELTRFCEEQGLASVCRGPLGMGLITGKYGAGTRLPQEDVRGADHDWMHANSEFPSGRPNKAWLAAIEAVREILTGGGRTIAQGALAWLWAFSEATIPIPGFKGLPQAEENAGALEFGALPRAQMAEIAELLAHEAAVA
jgi:aryl-alcohol dehydrogenase-like predicted oxidoreductase